MTDHTHCLNLKTTVCHPACLHFICIKLLNNLTLTTFSSLREGPENTSSATLVAKTSSLINRNMLIHTSLKQDLYLKSKITQTCFQRNVKKIMVKNTKNNNIVCNFPPTHSAPFFLFNHQKLSHFIKLRCIMYSKLIIIAK